MEAMTMKESKRGNISGVLKFNSLLGHWFGAARTVVVEKQSITLEQGSIIGIGSAENYLVYAVFKDNGTK